MVAFRGSLLVDFAEKNLDNGTVFCSANAASILGAPTRLARADENVAANIPPNTSEGYKALSTIAVKLVRSSFMGMNRADT